MNDVSCENPSDFKLFSPDANAAFISLASVFCAALKKYAYKRKAIFDSADISKYQVEHFFKVR